ncbi:hypothetical protein HaLaN_32759, partial [Haematococcus lacustris]
MLYSWCSSNQHSFPCKTSPAKVLLPCSCCQLAASASLSMPAGLRAVGGLVQVLLDGGHVG